MVLVSILLTPVERPHPDGYHDTSFGHADLFWVSAVVPRKREKGLKRGLVLANTHIGPIEGTKLNKTTNATPSVASCHLDASQVKGTKRGR